MLIGAWPSGRVRDTDEGSIMTSIEVYGPGPYKVTTGVHGAFRATEREFDTIEEAVGRAKRWASSNSIGSYWAQVHNAEGRMVAQYN